MGHRTLAGIATLVGIAVGFAAGRQFPASTPPVPHSVDSPAAAKAEGPALTETLAQARDEREALEREVSALRARLADAPSSDLDARPEPAEVPSDAEAFDADSLLLAGVPDHEIEHLRARFDAFELDLLYLQDEANREGWEGGQLQRERQALRAEMRSELGDDDYDAMLFATGRKNRVIATDVLAGSAADQAGIRSGDAILEYAGERIFDAMSLMRATREGEAGVPTEIRAERDGRVVRVFVPRGPVGIRLGRERRLPDRFR